MVRTAVVLRRLVLVLVTLALVAPSSAGAARGCPDGRFVVRGEDGALIVGTAPRDVIVVADGRVAIEGTCAADTTRSVHVRRTRGGTRVTASWDACGGAQRVRLVATITRNSGCDFMMVVRRARGGPAKHWLATRSQCGDGYVDPGIGEACDGHGCADGQPCNADCTCPPTPTTSTSTSSSTTTSTSTSMTTTTSTSSSTSSSTSTSTTTSSSTSVPTTSSSSSTSTSTSTTLPDPCPHNPAGGPSHLVLTTPLAGTGGDLDVGWTGTLHNLPLPGGAHLDACLTGCDAASTCSGTSPGSASGALLGPPVPVLDGPDARCLVVRVTGDFTVRTADPRTGAIDATVGLRAELYATSSEPGQVCPRCTSTAPDQGGVCVGGADDGAPCRLEATRSIVGPKGDDEYRLSSSCRPAGAPVVAVSLTLDPLRTDAVTSPACPSQTTTNACGDVACIPTCANRACAFAALDPVDGSDRCQDQRGGLSESCCDDAANSTPCYASTVTRTGIARAPVASGTDAFPASSDVVLASAACAAATGDATLDATTIGLPAPAGVVLPVRAAWLP